MDADERMPWGIVGAAAAAVLVGNGLARFAYSPLLPVLIGQGWFSPGAAAYLGAANLLGYLVGALAARPVAQRVGMRAALRGGMLLAAMSLLACCVPMPFAWFFVWRLVSGVMGGVLMILGPSLALARVPLRWRGLASGLIFTGVGAGIAASGTLVPMLLEWGLTTAWLGLGLVSLLLTAVVWGAWPRVAPSRLPAGGAAGEGPSWAFVGLCVSYGLCAVGLVPHMIFLVDYVARGQGRGLAAGSVAWVLFGLGALCGAVVVGRVMDWVGAAAAMRITIAVEFGCVVVLAFVSDPMGAGVGAFVAGLCVSGLSTVMLGRVQEVAGSDLGRRQRRWTEATVAWAIGQAAAAYGMAWLYAETHGYAALLAAAAAALVAAGAVEVGSVLVVGERRPQCGR